jgi:hypothetical protein
VCTPPTPTPPTPPASRCQAAERARAEVTFWKAELDHAVDEKALLLERYTLLYRHAFDLEQYAIGLGAENTELRHVLERTLQDERSAAVRAAAAGADAPGAADAGSDASEAAGSSSGASGTYAALAARLSLSGPLQSPATTAAGAFSSVSV